MPGARCARSRACNDSRSTRVSHHGHTGITRHSPRNGFNGFLRALPGDRAFLPPSPAEVASAQLDASVGASGPHDFAVRIKRLVRSAAASTASRPASVTIAKRPSCERDGRVGKVICPTGKAEIFFTRGLDRANSPDLPVEAGQVLRSCDGIGPRRLIGSQTGYLSRKSPEGAGCSLKRP